MFANASAHPGLLIPDLRAANRAGYRLSVKAPVGRIVIFCRAIRAKRKVRHAGIDAVVRDIAHNAETRSAVGAIDKRIPVAAVIRIEELSLAVGTDGKVRRDRQKVFRSVFTFLDGKFLENLQRGRKEHKAVYLG